jgi:hypothetical protein
MGRPLVCAEAHVVGHHPDDDQKGDPDKQPEEASSAAVIHLINPGTAF